MTTDMNYINFYNELYNLKEKCYDEIINLISTYRAETNVYQFEDAPIRIHLLDGFTDTFVEDECYAIQWDEEENMLYYLSAPDCDVENIEQYDAIGIDAIQVNDLIAIYEEMYKNVK